jgi:hypothetical protein
MALSYERVFSRAVCFYGKFQGGEYGVEIGHRRPVYSKNASKPLYYA